METSLVLLIVTWMNNFRNNLVRMIHDKETEKRKKAKILLFHHDHHLGKNISKTRNGKEKREINSILRGFREVIFQDQDENKS